MMKNDENVGVKMRNFWLFFCWSSQVTSAFFSVNLLIGIPPRSPTPSLPPQREQRRVNLDPL
jgi:hypothetical protein